MRYQDILSLWRRGGLTRRQARRAVEAEDDLKWRDIAGSFALPVPGMSSGNPSGNPYCYVRGPRVAYDVPNGWASSPICHLPNGHAGPHRYHSEVGGGYTVEWWQATPASGDVTPSA